MRDNDILSELKSSIEGLNKLTISEAQELYQKAINTANHSLKKNYMDKLILETLYVVYNYIDNNHTEIFSSTIYDINDIISAFTETWINKIYEGKLLEVTQFSLLFTPSFFNSVYQNLGGQRVDCNTLFEIPALDFALLFAKFIELKNKGIDFSVKDVIGDYFSEVSQYYPEKGTYLVETFEKIYENLGLNELDDLNINSQKVRNYLKLITSAGLQESIRDDLIDEQKMEDQVIQGMISGPFVHAVDGELKNPNLIESVHLYFGLDDKIQRTLSETAKIQSKDKEIIRQRLEKSYRILRISPKIKKFR